MTLPEYDPRQGKFTRITTLGFGGASGALQIHNGDWQYVFASAPVYGFSNEKGDFIPSTSVVRAYR